MIRGLPEEEFFAPGHRACAGCGGAIALRHVLKATGKNVIVVQATGCMEVVSSPYPETAWKVPWIHVAFETAAPTASGIARALKAQGREDVKVLAFGGDGATFDIGFGGISGTFERNENILYVCNENGAYMNTGIQRSSATPFGAAATTMPAGKKIPGKREQKKPLALILAAHNSPYVATASVCDINDIHRKVKKAMAIKGPTYIEIFSSCPTGWYCDSSKAIEVARLALQTRVSPLYEIENGKVTITHDITEPKPVEEYLKAQGRFKHLTPEQIKEIQAQVDKEWAKLKKLQEAGCEI
ncbi:MAG: pyruvate synthase subunit PorB [Candidatus Diapherotrites archaeon]